MNEERKAAATLTPAPAYPEELPATTATRKRAVPAFSHEVAANQKGPDPRDATAPYGDGIFNGTDDPSRFSTPPARKR